MEGQQNNQDSFGNGYNNDTNWKLGLFYFNPKDKRIFPPKRFGFGWTINFANPLSVLTLLIILSFVFYTFYHQ